jgi:hypothetical protein
MTSLIDKGEPTNAELKQQSAEASMKDAGIPKSYWAKGLAQAGTEKSEAVLAWLKARGRADIRDGVGVTFCDRKDREVFLLTARALLLLNTNVVVMDPITYFTGKGRRFEMVRDARAIFWEDLYNPINSDHNPYTDRERAIMTRTIQLFHEEGKAQFALLDRDPRGAKPQWWGDAALDVLFDNNHVR